MARFLAALAFMVFAFGAGLVFSAQMNNKSWARRQQQLPRFQAVRATVLDKGFSEGRRWIRFTCRVGAESVDGARLTSSGSHAGWEGFEEGREYDAFYDPGFAECVLLVDEKVQAVNGELRASWQAAPVFAGVSAALALAAYGLARGGRRFAPERRDAPAAPERADGWWTRAVAARWDGRTQPDRSGGIGEAVFLAVLRVAVLAPPAFLLFIRPVVVYRCEPKGGAASCAVERRAGGLLFLGRTEVAGIRRAEAQTTTRRFTTHEPGRPSQSSNASSTVGSLTLMGEDDRVLYSETVDDPVGRSGEWLADEINRMAQGARTTPFLAWRVTWIPSLFATVLVLLMGTALIAAAARRLRSRTDEKRALLMAFVFVFLLCSMAWTLAILGRFPMPLAEALGVPPGV